MSIELDLLSALRQLAPQTTAADAYRFSVMADDQTFDVIYESGSYSSLTLRASYDRAAKQVAAIDNQGYRETAAELRAPRPLAIVLRREKADDVAAKESRVASEHQTGDPSFDRAVYIDTPTTDRKLLATVLNKDTRAAVLALLNLDIPAVNIDEDGFVCIRLTGFLSTTPAKERGPRMVKAFAALLNSLPRVVATGAEALKRRSLKGVGVLTLIVVAVVPIVYLVVLYDVFGLTEPGSEAGETVFKQGQGGTALIAFVGGTVVANVLGGLATLIMRPYVLARLRGASDSHRRIRAVLILIYAWVGMVGFLAGSGITLWLEARP